MFFLCTCREEEFQFHFFQFARKMERMKERAQGKIEDAQGSLSGLQIPADPADNSETGRKMMFPFKTDWIIKNYRISIVYL